MPIAPPTLDDRRWDDLRKELIARIPTHTPEWTNYHSASDPGVTLLELFAFLGESILYRTNRIPEQTRLAFLRLLGLGLHPGAPARALITLRSSEKTALTLATGLELRAGKLAFHLDAGLDVLPIEAFVCHKALIRDDALLASYRLLYQALPELANAKLALYQTTPLGPTGIPFGSQTRSIDGAVWIALLARKGDDLTLVRSALAGRVLSLGLAPAPTTLGRDLDIRGNARERGPGFEAHLCTGTGTDKAPTWYPLGSVRGCLESTNVVSLVLPAADHLIAWPSEALDDGVGELPPALMDSALAARLLVWLRLRPLGDPDVSLRWVGINAALATQGDRIHGEPLGLGDGTPDQRLRTAQRPVVPGSLRVRVDRRAWPVVDDVQAAPREGSDDALVVQVDWEAGELRFGTGLTGARPPTNATITADYEVHAGDAGNLGVGEISKLADPRVKVDNPIPTWGGAAPEQLADGERQVARWLQHRDRLVTAADFETLVRRTPAIELARVDVLAAFHPLLATQRPGDAPGCVTILVVPPAARSGEAPMPSDAALEAICSWLEPRRLVTTELFLRGPDYTPIHVSVGIEVTPRPPGSSIAEVLAAVRDALRDALSPVPTARGPGWPLARPVRRDELLVVAASVPGVQAVLGIQLSANASDTDLASIPLAGLQLPWLQAIAVREGPPDSVAALRPSQAANANANAADAPRVVPLPVIPDECH